MLCREYTVDNPELRVPVIFYQNKNSSSVRPIPLSGSVFINVPFDSKSYNTLQTPKLTKFFKSFQKDSKRIFKIFPLRVPTNKYVFTVYFVKNILRSLIHSRDLRR